VAGRVRVAQSWKRDLFAKAAVAGELGEVLAGEVPGRLGNEVSVFKSLGLPIEDAVACEQVYRLALDRGLGEEIAFP